MRSVALPLAVLASGVASLAEAVDIALEKCDASTKQTIAQGDAYSKVDVFALENCVQIGDTAKYEQLKLDASDSIYKMFTYTDVDCTEADSDTSAVNVAVATCDGTTEYSVLVAAFTEPIQLLSADYTIVEGTHGSGDTNCATPSTSYTRYHVNDVDTCVENVMLTNDTNTYTLTTYTAPTGSEVACATAPEGTVITFADGDCNEVGAARMKYYEYEAPTESPTKSPTVPTVPPTPAPTEPLTKVALEKCVDNAPIVPGEAYSEVEIFALDTCVDVVGDTTTTSQQVKLDSGVYKVFKYTGAGCVDANVVATDTVLLASGDSSDCSPSGTGNGHTHNLVSANFSGVDDLLSENYTIVEALFEGVLQCPVDTTEVTSYTRYHSAIVDGACVNDKIVTYDDVSKEYTVTKYEAATDANAASCETVTADTGDDVKFTIGKCLDGDLNSMMYYEYVATTEPPTVLPTNATDAPTSAPTDATEYAVFHKCNGEVLTENPNVLIVRALDTCQASGDKFTELKSEDGSYTEYTHETAACNDPSPVPATFFAKDGDCTGHDQVPVETMNLEEPVTADYPVAVLKYSGENCTDGTLKSLDLYHSDFTSGDCINNATLVVDNTNYTFTAYTDEACSEGDVPTSYEEDTCMSEEGSSSMLVVYSEHEHANGSGHVALSTFSLILIAAATLL